MSDIRKDHYREVNQADLDNCIECFTTTAEPHATESEKASFNNLARTAQRFVNDSGFERYLRELWRKIRAILLRQEWFIIDMFRDKIQRPNDYRDRKRFDELKDQGLKCMECGDIDGLREIISGLFGIMKNVSSDDQRLNVNIIGS